MLTLDPFEIHITGDASIHEVAQPLEVKTISIDLLDRAGQVMRSEEMTSQIKRFATVAEATAYAEHVAEWLRKEGVTIYRVKVECPYLEKHLLGSKYLESHYITTDFTHPVSRTKGKDRLLATERISTVGVPKSVCDAFAAKFPESQLELCVYDTYQSQDADWFAAYYGSPAKAGTA